MLRYEKNLSEFIRFHELEGKQAIAVTLAFELASSIYEKEIDELKAENERLRKAAKPCIDYWFEENNTTHDEDNKAFLELSNVYYRRENKFVRVHYQYCNLQSDLPIQESIDDVEK